MIEGTSNPSRHSTLPAKADVVIIGAGIVGCSTAYHLSTIGDRDVVVVEQGQFFDTGGSTSHAPGLIGQASSSRPMSELAQYTVALFTDLDSVSAPCFDQVGSLDLAHSEPRWEDFRRFVADANSWGLDGAVLLTPADVTRRIPLLDTDGIHGGLFIPTDGYADAVTAAGALGREADANGVSFHSQTKVTDIETTNGQVDVVRTDSGPIATQQVLLATNIWTRILGDRLDVELPVFPVEHQYAVTEPLEELEEHRSNRRLPLVRARDQWIYVRQHDDAIGIGTYHDEPTVVEPAAIDGPDGGSSAPALRRFSESEFHPALEATRDVLPALEGVEIDHGINGLFALTPDGMPIVGEAPRIDGLWVAGAVWVTQAGGVGHVLAEWMERGTPKLNDDTFDVREFRIDRFHSDSDSSIREQCAQQYHAIYEHYLTKQDS